MKNEIHPKYFSHAAVACACGATFKTGSTKEKMEVEICSACHPFYTGTQRLVDTAGKVERFQERRAKAHAAQTTGKKKTIRTRERAQGVKAKKEK